MLSLGVGLTSVPVLSRRGPAYDPYAAALFARLPATPSALRRKLINDLIVNMRDHAIFETKLDAFYQPALGMDDPGYTTVNDAFLARRNLIKDAFNLTASASPAFATDRGYTGDGVAAYLSTGFNPSTAPTPKYLQDAATMFSWSRTSNDGSYSDIGTSSGAIVASVRPRVGGGISVASNSATADGVAQATGIGLSAFSRTGATAVKAYKNGAPVVTASTASNGVPNAVITLLARAGAAQFSINQVAIAGFGGPLSDADHSALYSVVNTSLTAIGAA